MIVCLVLLASCSSVGEPQAGPPVVASSSGTVDPNAAGRRLDRVERWRADLSSLLPEAGRLHPDLRDGIPASLTDQVARLRESAARLDDDELMVGLMRVATHFAREGRDGHTGLFVWGDGNPRVHSLPLRWWFFADGLYVEDQLGSADLVGSRVVGIGGHRLAEVLRRVDPLVPRDNAATVLAVRPRYLLVPEVLHGLGLVAGTGPVELEVVDRAGRRRAVDIDPVSMSTYNSWAGPYGLEIVPRPGVAAGGGPLRHMVVDRHALLVDYSAVAPLQPTELSSLRRLARRPEIDRIVVDVRRNTGGEVGEELPLVDLLSDRRVVGDRDVFVLTGRTTFSAASRFVAELASARPVTLVGEGMGGSFPSYGNAEPLRLEHTGFTLSVATTREAATDVGSPDLGPDLRVPVSSTDYLRGRDPVLAAALIASTGR